MLVRYAKVGALAAAVLVLVVEGFFVYLWYDRYWGVGPAPDAASNGGPVSEVTVPEGTMIEGTALERTTADGTAAFVHRATGQNSRGDYTYLDAPRTDGNPNAVILAFPAASYGHNVGVWYEPERRRWAIFNQDLAAVPAGATFDVVLPSRSERFVHEATEANVFGDTTYIDDPLVNGRPDAEVSVTQNWNPGGGRGVYNDHPVGVLYDEDVDRWFVYNEDGARVPEGAAFNVAVAG